MTPIGELVENAPREKLRDVQWQKLQELLRLVSDRNRFYTEKWRKAGIAPEELKSRLESDIGKWVAVIERAGIPKQ